MSIEYTFEPMRDEDDDIIAIARSNQGVSFKVIGTEERSALGGVNVNIYSNKEVPIDTDYVIIVFLPMLRQIHMQGRMDTFLEGAAWAVDQMEGLEDLGLTEI